MADDKIPHPMEGEGKDSPTLSEKESGAHIEQIKPSERVEGHPGYHEKDGLRTYGDDQDHDHEPPVSVQFHCLVRYTDLCHNGQRKGS
jgi:hypothetical protein